MKRFQYIVSLHLVSLSRSRRMLRISLVTLRVILISFLCLLFAGCPPVVIVSPVSEPIFIKKAETFRAKENCWIVSQGWMREAIEHTR